MIDRYGRTIRYLRLSVTDLCSYRCVYCMAEEGVEKRRHGDVLSIEELAEIGAAAVRCGVDKIRLTGGEPLVRRGILTLCGSTEAHALASKPIRYVFGDERDRWAASAGAEGDPWKLAMRRQTTFYNAKAVEVSTPTVKGASAIDSAYAKGSMARWVSRCPHCKKYHEIRWADSRFEYEEHEIKRELLCKSTYKAYQETVEYH